MPVELTTVRGLAHGTQSFTLAFPQARDAEDKIITWLRDLIS